jgi:integrase
VYWLRADVLELIKRIRRQDAERLFPFPSSETTKKIPSAFFHHYRRLLKFAGLPSTRKHLSQCLRRRHVNWLIIAAGVATAQEAVGHSDPSVTRRYYEDPTKTQRSPASSLLPMFLGPSK